MKRQTWKKLLTCIISIVLVCTTCFAVFAENAADSGEFTVQGTTLVKYNGNGGEVTVPDGIRALGAGAFEGTKVTKVNLPESLQEIGKYCFRKCDALAEITLPVHLWRISDESAFGNNPALKEIKVAEGNPTYKSVDGVLFTARGEKLVYYPDGKNGGYAIPEGTKMVGQAAFCAPDMETLTIPASLRKMDSGVLAGIQSLKDINVAADNPVYSSKDGVLYNKNNALLVKPAAKKAAEEKAAAEQIQNDFTIEGNKLVRYNGAGGEITVPDGVEILGEWAFSHSEVTRVNLPETVKVIECYCFHSSEELTEINLPASVVRIEEAQAFAYNPKLEAINIAEDNPFYTSVDGVLFTKDMKKLLYYPGGKNPGGEYAIPEGTEALGYTAIEGSSLTAVSLPASLVTLEGGNDFSANHELKEIRVAEGNKAFRSIDGMLFSQSGKLLCYPAGREQETLEAGDFPAEMTAIGPYAFQDVQHLKNVTIPDGITTIEWMCFTFSPSLETVMLPASVNYIAGYAFADCPELRQVVILNPDAYIVLDDERFSDDYRETMDFNIVDDSPNAIIYGYKGSTAEDYAAQRNDTFVSLGEAPARNPDAASEVVVPEWVPGCAQ